MKELLKQIEKSALEEINNAEKTETLEAVKVKYSGKKGELTNILKQMGGLSESERPIIGQMANQVR